MVGELRWNSTVGYERFGDVPINTTSPTHRITFTLPASTTVEQASLQGSTNGFSVAADTCTGSTFTAGGTCYLDVVAHPSIRGDEYAWVDLLAPAGGRILRTSLTEVGRETAEGGYTPVFPTRFLDTRHRIGVSTTTPLGAGATLGLQVTGKGEIPTSGVRAVVVNLTVVNPSSSGHLTAYPAGQARPTTSSINFSRGWVGANCVTVLVGAGGRVNIYNAFGKTAVVVDVLGYYSSAAATPQLAGGYGSYRPVRPERLIDTRQPGGGGPVKSGHAVVQVLDYGPDITDHMRAVALNVVATAPQASGYLSTWGPRDGYTDSSTLNYTKGRTVSNMVVVPVSFHYDPRTGVSLPEFVVGNQGAATHIVVDIVGFFDDNRTDLGLRFNAVTPTRIVDTRKGQGATPLLGRIAQVVATPEAMARRGTRALVTNTTVVKPTVSSFLTMWAHDGSARPNVSNVNVSSGQVVANMTMTGLGPDLAFTMYSNAGREDIVIDIAGTLDQYPSARPTSAVATTGNGATVALRTPLTLLTPPALGGLGRRSLPS